MEAEACAVPLTSIIAGAQGDAGETNTNLVGLCVIGEKPAERWDQGDRKPWGPSIAGPNRTPGPGRVCRLGKVAPVLWFCGLRLLFISLLWLPLFPAEPVGPAQSSVPVLVGELA